MERYIFSRIPALQKKGRFQGSITQGSNGSNLGSNHSCPFFYCDKCC